MQDGLKHYYTSHLRTADARWLEPARPPKPGGELYSVKVVIWRAGRACGAGAMTGRVWVCARWGDESPAQYAAIARRGAACLRRAWTFIKKCYLGREGGRRDRLLEIKQHWNHDGCPGTAIPRRALALCAVLLHATLLSSYLVILALSLTLVSELFMWRLKR